MTPAQELHQAAERLRELAADEDAWRYDDHLGYVRDRNGDPVCEATETVGCWIAAMSPAVAEPLARLLTEAANDLDNNGAHPFKYAHHLAFARAINGTETTR